MFGDLKGMMDKRNLSPTNNSIYRKQRKGKI